MKHLFLLLPFLTLLTTPTTAQQRSATIDYNQTLFARDPNAARKNAEVEQKIQQLASGNKLASVPVIVPVVVHVVWNQAVENIPDSQIVSQIEVMNEDFNRLNADTVNTPGIFQSVAASANIQFCLAQVDPNGNPTTGIHRVQTTASSWSPVTRVMDNAYGGTDVWDPANYMNIYVCNITNGLLGMASFPGGPPATEGIIIYYRVFGRVGNLMAPYNLGRTATQEAGHYFQLYPIDYNFCTGTNANNCLTQGDRVCDTPPQDFSINCFSPSVNTCTETSPFPPPYTSDMPDMNCNFEGFAADSCMNMFTLGQAQRMNATIAAYYTWQQNTAVLCQPLSVIEHADETSVTVFPSIASDYFAVKSNNSIQSIFISDALGKNVIQLENLKLTETDINIAHLNAGLYFVSVYLHESVVVKRIVIQ